MNYYYENKKNVRNLVGLTACMVPLEDVFSMEPAYDKLTYLCKIPHFCCQTKRKTSILQIRKMR